MRTIGDLERIRRHHAAAAEGARLEARRAGLEVGERLRAALGVLDLYKTTTFKYEDVGIEQNRNAVVSVRVCSGASVFAQRILPSIVDIWQIL